ncbi:MAG TPA: tRNA uridine-5-carboxymethylaminomethyl(34) synthesis GTPase MnmE [Devosia sp.]|nr:tRNA uridine-5-carboxymethylaminomethyl(34) synthesis GTPase MnmE [Devosia sp.]
MRGGDTIVALSSGAVPSGVAVVRISGPRARELVEGLAGAMPNPRYLSLRELRWGGELIDRGLIAWFPGPNSFTGEDCAELQMHGSRAVIGALLGMLSSQPGVRLAEAGEFTRRAFENGKLDLTAVEGLGDLIEAETESQRRQALARLDGNLSTRIENWRLKLLDLQAEIAAQLDFADEGDVGELSGNFATELAALKADMERAAASFAQGRRVREGFRVALAGPPNVGKSSLLNALSQTDAAIVSDEPGTTRDVKEVALELGGQLVVLVDMAGLRDTESRAEAEGVRRARRQIEAADLVLWLTAPDVSATEKPAANCPVWEIATKADLGGGDISVRTGYGIDELLGRLKVAAADGVGGEPAVVSRERDVVALRMAVAELEGIDLDRLELAAESLRAAGHVLARLVGKVDAEMVLDRLFSAFCIGK